jgi:hypothetical protein
MSGRRWHANWWGSEDANTFAMMLVMLPMLITAFGLGVDMTHNQYIRHELQAAADMATVAAAGVTEIDPNGQVSRIVPTPAYDTLRKVYAANRLDGPATLDCLSGTKQRCWLERTPPAVSADRLSIQFNIREQSHNGFLAVFGVPKQAYNLTSTARVKQTTQ